MIVNNEKTAFQLDVKDCAVITRGDVRIVLGENGEWAVYENNVAVYPPIAASGLKIGDRMPDGTVFAGISPDTQSPMYALPQDEGILMDWDQAVDYAAGYKGYGRQAGAFRLPSPAELNVLFNNAASIGGFNTTGSPQAGWYTTGAAYDDKFARDQRFSDGNRSWNKKIELSSIRLLCS